MSGYFGVRDAESYPNPTTGTRSQRPSTQATALTQYKVAREMEPLQRKVVDWAKKILESHKDVGLGFLSEASSKFAKRSADAMRQGALANPNGPAKQSRSLAFGADGFPVAGFYGRVGEGVISKSTAPRGVNVPFSAPVGDKTVAESIQAMAVAAYGNDVMFDFTYCENPAKKSEYYEKACTVGILLASFTPVVNGDAVVTAFADAERRLGAIGQAYADQLKSDAAPTAADRVDYGITILPSYNMPKSGGKVMSDAQVVFTFPGSRLCLLAERAGVQLTFPAGDGSFKTAIVQLPFGRVKIAAPPKELLPGAVAAIQNKTRTKWLSICGPEVRKFLGRLVNAPGGAQLVQTNPDVRRFVSQVAQFGFPLAAAGYGRSSCDFPSNSQFTHVADAGGMAQGLAMWSVLHNLDKITINGKRADKLKENELYDFIDRLAKKDDSVIVQWNDDYKTAYSRRGTSYLKDAVKMYNPTAMEAQALDQHTVLGLIRGRDNVRVTDLSKAKGLSDRAIVSTRSGKIRMVPPSMVRQGGGVESLLSGQELAKAVAAHNTSGALPGYLQNAFKQQAKSKAIGRALKNFTKLHNIYVSGAGNNLPESNIDNAITGVNLGFAADHNFGSYGLFNGTASKPFAIQGVDNFKDALRAQATNINTALDVTVAQDQNIATAAHIASLFGFPIKAGIPPPSNAATITLDALKEAVVGDYAEVDAPPFTFAQNAYAVARAPALPNVGGSGVQQPGQQQPQGQQQRQKKGNRQGNVA